MGRVIACTAVAVLAAVVTLAGTTAGVLSAVVPRLPGTGPGCPAPAGCDPGALPAVSPAGWTRPVPGRIVSGFRTPARPGHDGVDLAAPRGTTIRAASAGVVVTVVCNIAGRSRPPEGHPTGCDHDGHPGLGGCGWYVQIRHPGNLVTRYCHMLRQPAVHPGQTVGTGQPIGVVGTSGNSSGPHLHYETHTGYPAHTGNATDPVPFMAARGVTL